MKKTAVVMIIAATLFCTETFAWGKKTEEKKEKTQSERDVGDVLEAAGNGIANGLNKAGEGIKKGLGKLKEKSEDDTKEKAKNKANDIGQKVGDAVRGGAEKTEREISTHSAKILTGTLKVKGKGKNAKFTLKAEDGNTYNVTTISGSEDSLLKLSAYNKQKIKITGMLNSETNTITLTTYKLAGDN